MKKLKLVAALLTLCVLATSCGTAQTVAPETDASEEAQAVAPESDASEEAQTVAPETVASEEAQAVTPENDASEEAATAAPEIHAIAPDASMETVGDDYGADAFANFLDHPDSRYFAINDYYAMESGGSLHILPRFETYQQTTEYTCGAAAALMVLNRYGIHDYNEMQIAELAGTSQTTGTTPEGLAAFFEGIGLRTELHASETPQFTDITKLEEFFVGNIDAGTPVMVDWLDWRGHWQVVIGIDLCGADSPYDDVLIMADPYDVTDHYQDGYYLVPFGRFFEMWREGVCTGKAVPYEQPYVIAYRPES